jgi:hypothetical protein
VTTGATGVADRDKSAMGTLRLSLEIDAEHDPISGRLQPADGGAVHEFAGWIEFVQALERARSDVALDGGGPDDQPHGP